MKSGSFPREKDHSASVRLRPVRWNSIQCCVVVSALIALVGCDFYWMGRTEPRVMPVNELSPEQQQQISDAQTAKSAGNYTTALVLFQELLAENPTVTTAYIGIGDIHIIQKDYDKAEPAFRRAARLEPRNFEAQYGLGLALQMLDRFIEAVRAYHRALTIDPDNVKANLNLATTYLQMEEPHSAIIFAEKAVDLDPSNGPARINLGAAYESIGENQNAIEQYTAALELVADTAPLMMNLINVLAKEKRYQEAANTAQNLVRIAPSANAYERLGWCYFRLARYEQSLASYREAVEIEPYHWQSHNGIGVNSLNVWLLSKKRDRNALQEAKKAFRRSLRINTNQPKLIAIMSNYGL